MEDLKRLLDDMGIKMSLPGLSGGLEQQWGCDENGCSNYQNDACKTVVGDDGCYTVTCVGGSCYANSCTNHSCTGYSCNSNMSGCSIDACGGAICLNAGCSAGGACSSLVHGHCGGATCGTGDICSNSP